MLRQEQSDGLVNFIENKIAEIKKEIEYEEDCWDEAPVRNKSEFLEMKHSDSLSELGWKLDEWKQLLRDAEDIEIVDDTPVASPGRMAKTISAAGIIGVSLVIALLIAVPFLFENSDLAWK